MHSIRARIFLVLMSTMILASCATMPGGVGLTTSSYDGTKQLVMKPGWANSGFNLSASLLVGVWKSSKMKNDEAILIVRNNAIESFSVTHPNFFIRIDGKEEALSPLERTSNIEVSSQSDVAHTTQEYKIKVSLISRMLASKDVRFKLMLRSGYVEGDLSQTGPSTARKGFSDFMTKATSVFQTSANEKKSN